MKTIDQLTEREIVRIAAEDVMGYDILSTRNCGALLCLKHPNITQRIVFSPPTDANDDVKVLEHVLSEWNLHELLAVDTKLAELSADMDRGVVGNFLFYKAGDYTRAAVAVVLARKEQEDG